jgi:AmmeMemoRadiSam system protein A
MNSGLRDETRPDELARLLPIARESIEAWIDSREAVMPAIEGRLALPSPVFVSIYIDRELRGCVGSLTAESPSVAEETFRNARRAAFEDPRFPPLTREELDRCELEVSVVGEIEPVSDAGQLDPAAYGVIVTGDRGRRGVLLPSLAGVDSVERQLAIARSKAGLGDDDPVSIRRFAVTRVVSEDSRKR